MDETTPEPTPVPQAQPTRVENQSAADRRVQVAAAKLRAALDERLGRPTPTETKALAEEDF